MSISAPPTQLRDTRSDAKSWVSRVKETPRQLTEVWDDRTSSLPSYKQKSLLRQRQELTNFVKPDATNAEAAVEAVEGLAGMGRDSRLQQRFGVLEINPTSGRRWEAKDGKYTDTLTRHNDTRPVPVFPNATIGGGQPFETQPTYGTLLTQTNVDIKDSTKEVSDKDQRQKLNGAQRSARRARTSSGSSATRLPTTRRSSKSAASMIGTSRWTHAPSGLRRTASGAGRSSRTKPTAREWTH